MKQAKVTIGLVFVLIGLGFAAIGIVSISDKQEYVKEAELIIATIDDIESYTTRDSDGDYIIRYNAYVNYKYQDEEYNHMPLAEYSRRMKEGNSIILYIDPDNPSDVRYKDGLYKDDIIFVSFGSFFGLIGIVSLISLIVCIIKQNRIKQEGQQLRLLITNVCADLTVTINGYHPNYVICDYTDWNSKIYILKSESSMKISEDMINKKVTVYFIDESNYFVDIKSIDDF